MKTIFLLISMLFVACETQQNQPQVQETGIAKKYRYLALGDSYTIGEDVKPEHCWSVLLADLLKRRNYENTQLDIIAKTGWTTADLLQQLEQNPPAQNYDLVSLLIGVNNQYRGQSVERYRIELNTLLDKAVKYAGNQKERVIVLSIPDWGRSPFAESNNVDKAKIAREIDIFNAVAKSECEKRQIIFIDITRITRDNATSRSAFASDGLHFSVSVYLSWADAVLNTVLKILA